MELIFLQTKEIKAFYNELKNRNIDFTASIIVNFGGNSEQIFEFETIYEVY